jgi:hypothetical protein
MVILNLIRSLYFGTLIKTILLITLCYRLLGFQNFGSHPISSVTGGEQLPVICFIDLTDYQSVTFSIKFEYFICSFLFVQKRTKKVHPKTMTARFFRDA